MSRIVYLPILTLFGLLFGSFANVLIWRLPRGESVVSPPSHCPACNTDIAWYDNIPLFSWAILLRGRCRHCGQPISGRYPLVELLSGLLWLLAGLAYGFTPRTGVAILFFYTLLVLSFIDIDTMRLPNPIVGTLFAAGVVSVVVSQVTGIPLAPLVAAGTGLLSDPLSSAVVGCLVSAGLAAVIAAVYARVRDVQGFGMGDVKLLGTIGVFVGVYGVLAFFLGSVLGAVYGLSIARAKGVPAREMKFPFGPFLALAAVIVAVWGPRVLSWYFSLFGQAMM